METQESEVQPRPFDSLDGDETSELTELRQAYNARVEEWIAAIRSEEELAKVDHEVVAVDRWEHAHFAEEDARNEAKKARQDYQDALRRILYHF